MPPPILTTFLVLTVILVLLPSEVAAFGAGDIPDFSYLEGKAFRHGDIENTLLELVKVVGHSHSAGFIGFAQSVISSATGGAKFSKEDVKRVYFGNWLRDYSQAMDIAGLSKLSADTITLIVGILGFLEFGFATNEFEVNQDRLGVYLPVEHIDNPRGYAEKEGNAQQYNQKLRPPVDPRELEIDSRTGMKNYMATEKRGWDTSTAFIRRTLRECIQKGRNAKDNEGPELWEAYRLLGQGLHTLEDFTAHSNWVEIALRKLGYREVFCHVGDGVYVDSPNGQVPPIVTGTFGGADFFHSLLGETTDKISQSSVTDLSAKMSNQNSNAIAGLKDILGKLKTLGGNDSDSQMSQADEMKRKSENYHFDPKHALPPEVVKNLREVLRFHDDVMRGIMAKLAMVPGLTDLIDGLSNALNAFVYTTIAPYVTPVLTQVTSAIGEGSSAVISSADQWEVFNDRNASDPTHSVLSKDHFGIILNEPAGKVAKVVVEHSVNLVVQAWSDNSNPDDAIDKILEAFHHPYYNNGRSEIQKKMIAVVEQWLGGMDQSKARETISCLTKEAVRGGRNKRQGEGPDGQGSMAGYSGGYSTGRQTGGSYGGGSTPQSYSSGDYQQPESKRGGSGGNTNTASSYGRNTQSNYGGSGGNYGGDPETGYGRPDDNPYGSHKKSSEKPKPGQFDSRSGQRGSGDTYRANQGSYGQQDNRSYESAQNPYGQSDATYEDNRATGGRFDSNSYQSTQSSYRQRDDYSYGSAGGGYGQSENKPHKATQGSHERSDHSYQSNLGGYGRSDDNSSGLPENTFGDNPTRRGRSDDSPYGDGQRSYDKPGSGYNTGSYSQQEGRSGYGNSGGDYVPKRNEDDRPYDTSSHRSGYQPSYQPSETTYSSDNTYTSGNTGSSAGGYPGAEVDRKDHKKKKHHKGHSSSDDETYGVVKLNLRDDDDRRRRHGDEDYARSGGYGGGR